MSQHIDFGQAQTLAQQVLPQQTWTGQQIIGLAQNDYHVRSSRSLAIASRWKSIAIDDAYIWGTITLKNTAGTISINTASSNTPIGTASKAVKKASEKTVPTVNSKKQVIQTAIRLKDFHSNCTCVSHHSPCQHAMALLFLLDEVNYSGNNIFSNSPRPDWLVESFKDVTEKRFTTELIDDETPTATKHKAIAQGLTELELWLSDLLRSGLNSFKDKPHDFTTAMSHRLIDSDLQDIARDITKLAMIPKQSSFTQHGDWPQLLLAEIGRLYALIQAFKKVDQLPKAVQGDVYMALGWPQLDSSSQTITDNWYILGKATEQQGRKKEQRTYLYGMNSEKLAYISRRYEANKATNQHLLTASTLHAELQFYNSQFPLKAKVSDTIKPKIITTQNTAQLSNLEFTSIAKAHEQYRQAKLKNPWLRYFPMLLTDVKPTRQQIKVAKGKSKIESWRIHDTDGYQLPLMRNFKYGWHFMSLGMSNQLNFLAEWNGYDLKPISLLQDEDLYDIHAFRGLT